MVGFSYNNVGFKYVKVGYVYDSIRFIRKNSWTNHGIFIFLIGFKR